MHMERMQLQLSAEQIRALRDRSAASGKSVASLIREAIDAWIGVDERKARIERALAAAGGFHSGLGDVAENHDRYLDEAYRE